MRYQRAPGDKKYRRVYLFGNGDVPEYEPFSSEFQVVECENKGVVLEILKEDGTSELYYESNIKDIVYGCSLDGKGIWVNASESDKICARLWMRKEHGAQTRYKLPDGVTKVDGIIKFSTQGGNNGVILEGDKYFEKAYRLIRS
jgi:hypothetical protein